MYKDVKKKLLAVVLCICMVAGIVEVVPRVQAAATKTGSYYEIAVHDDVGNADKNVYVKLNTETFVYNGTSQMPSISEVRLGAVDGTDVTDKFGLRLVGDPAKAISAGTHAVVLTDAKGVYSPAQDEGNQIEFTIKQATIEEFVCDWETTTLEYAVGGIAPTFKSVKIKTNEGEISYTEDVHKYFAATAIGQTGKKQESTISLSGTEQSNFTNGTTYTQKEYFDVAYSLGANGIVTLDNDEFVYTGSDLTDQVGVTINKNDNGTLSAVKSGVTSGSESALGFIFEKKTDEAGTWQTVSNVTDAGTYRVTIRWTNAANEPNGTFKINNELYTGTWSKEFDVIAGAVKTWEVLAYDYEESVRDYVDLTTSTKKYRIQFLEKHKNDAGEILPSGNDDAHPMQVKINGNVVSPTDYELDFGGNPPTAVGSYTMTIRITRGNYKGQTSKPITYFVYGKMNVESIAFVGWGASDVTELPYNNKGYEVDKNNLTVKSEGMTVDGALYDIEYQYEDGKNSGQFATAATYDADEMKSVGLKRIAVIGKGVYDGEVAYWEYTVEQIDINGKDSDKFKLKLQQDDSVPYKGAQYRPSITFTYDGTDIDESYYDVFYGTNTDVGAGTVTVRMRANGPYTGERECEFTITALQLSNAKCAGDGLSATDSKYSYTGNAIEPSFKIGTYELDKAKDYTVKYLDASGQALKSAPVNVGSYTAVLNESTNKKNVKGTDCRIAFSIIPRDINGSKDCSFTIKSPVAWNGGTVTPEVTCAGTLNLVEGTDYTINYANNTAPTVGKTVSASAIITGQGNLTGTKTMYFEITERSLDNGNIEVTPKVVGNGTNGTEPPYSVSFTVKDNGNEVAAAHKTLTATTDYVVESITYKTEKGYEPTTGDISSLERAGEYEVVLKGVGNYTDTKMVKVTCGVDISGAKLTLKDHKNLTYNGKTQHPTVTLSGTDQPYDGLVLEKTQAETDAAFGLVYDRTDGDDKAKADWSVDAGTITIRAKGNTAKGYYGTTKLSASYEIKPMKLSLAYEAVLTDADSKGVNNSKQTVYYYTFTGDSVKPTVVVSRSAVSGTLKNTLDEDVDYSVSYDAEDCSNVDQYTLTITGCGNFTGTLTAVFEVQPIDFETSGIIALFDKVGTYADPAPTLTLKLDGVKLTEGEDYTLATPQRAAPDDPDALEVEEGGKKVKKYTWIYDVTGLNNIKGKYRFKREVNETSLIAAADYAAPQAKETYISDGIDEITVYPGESVSQTVVEEKLKFSYQPSVGKAYFLEKGTDYEIVKWNAMSKPGEGSQLKITGKGGFIGDAVYNIPLYTDINRAEFLKDANGNYASTVYDGAKVSIDQLKKAIENDDWSDLISFKAIWTDEGATIPSDCYDVKAHTTNFGIGTELVLTVEGNRDKWYTSSRTVTVTVTGGLSDDPEITKVTIGTDNKVPWKQQEIQPSTQNGDAEAKVEVYDNVTNKKLVKDTDYTVTFTDADKVGIATATIEGIGSYQGTITREFKITCPMKDLTIKLTKDGSTAAYDPDVIPEYTFDTNTGENKPKVTLFYEGLGGVPTELADELYYSLTYSGYESAGDASVSIGSPKDNTYDGILLGGPVTVNYYLKQIETVDVNIGMPNPTYTGYEMDKTAIGLEISYDGKLLKENDYTLNFVKAVNVGEAKVIITLTGNFNGTIEKTFTIQPKSLADTDITGSASDLLYTGQPIVPVLEIGYPNGKTGKVELGRDYTIIGYQKADGTGRQDTPFTQVGSYQAVIKAVADGNYTGERVVDYKIIERGMTDGVEVFFDNTSAECPVINNVPVCTYNAKEHKPGVKVIYQSVTLTEGTDYTVEYTDNVNAGTATVTVTGTGSFTGDMKLHFTIAPKDITADDMIYRNENNRGFEDEQTFPWLQGTSQTPEISVYDSSRTENLNAVQVVGSAQEPVTNDTTECVVRYVPDSEKEELEDSQQPCSYGGRVTLTVTGVGNYTGTKTYTYYIGEDISDFYTLLNGKRSVSTAYNGLAQAPDMNAISVQAANMSDLTDENNEQRYDVAFFKGGFENKNRISGDEILDAGTYYISVVGVPAKGTYARSSESNSCVYTITPRSIQPEYILVSGYDGTYYYTGTPIEPKGIIVEDTELPFDSSSAQKRSVQLQSGKDYDITYSGNMSAGKASIIVTGKGNYTGQRVAYFNIVSSTVDGNNTWDGTSEGTGSITNGTTTIAADDIRLGYDNSMYNCMMYNGYERIPTVSINGVDTSEFIVTASNNVRPGVATLTITGRGNNYTGTIIKSYTIRANLAEYGVISSIADQTYTGYQITPYVTVTCGGNLLNAGSDYTVTYANNINVGSATVLVNAASDSYYIGTATGSFNISNTAGGMEITGYASSYTYTGYAVSPDIVVMMNGRVLNRGTDYLVTYSNNVNVGTASMTVTGIGSYSGTKTITYAIEAKNIENCLTTTVDNYRYTGNTYTPSVTITDSSTGKTLTAGTDYTITYSNNTNPGTATITVTALSRNYTGSKVISFKIKSAAVSGLRATTIKNNRIKLVWSDQDYADGYQICNEKNRVIASTTKNSYVVKNLTSCKTYRFKVRSYVENSDGSVSYGDFSTAISAKTMLNTPTLTAKSTSKGKVVLTWTKVAKATGYEIYYSTKKNGIYTKLKTVSKSSARRYVDAGLASGEKYYYTIRAYRTTNGVKTYSSYNTIRSVTVK